MGALEDRIFASLCALRDAEGALVCERHMFVFPWHSLTVNESLLDKGIRAVRAGDVLMLCRTEDLPPGED